MRYRYRAMDQDGHIRRAHGNAHSALVLEMQLQAQGLELLSCAPSRTPLWSWQQSIPRSELINFCFHLEQLLRAGVPMLEALDDLRDSSEHAAFSAILGELISAIAGGQTLSAAVRTHPAVFSPTFASLLHAGEISGRLPAVLDSLCQALKAEDELRAHTRKLLLYPAFIGIVVLAASAFLMLTLVPQLKQFVLQMGQELPLHSRILFALADWLPGHAHFLLIAICALALGAYLGWRQSAAWRRRYDLLKLQIPVIGPILKKVILARFAGTLAMLYAAGIPIIEAIASTRQVVGNLALEQALADVEQAVSDGKNLASAFAETALFPRLVIRMLRLGESTGELDQALLNVDYFYQRDVRESVGKAQALIEPVLTVLLGLLLGWIMLAAIGPIYQVISGIRP